MVKGKYQKSKIFGNLTSFRRSKKAIAMETIVIIVVALVVLVVVLWIFKDQIGAALKGYTGASKDATESLQGSKCETILRDKICMDDCAAAEGYKEVRAPSGGWSDCGKNNKPPKCCEEVY